MTAKATTKILKDIDSRFFETLADRFASGNKQVLVGFPNNGKMAADQDGKPADMLMAQLAAIHEFGAPSAGIPERSFLRAAILQNRDKYVRLNRQNIIKMLQNKQSMDGALNMLGVVAKGDVQQYIAEGSFAPLKPATIARKGSSKPLIDSGQMRQSVQYQLDPKNDKP